MAAFMSSVGSTGPNGSANGGSMTIRLVPREQRPSADKVIAELRSKVNLSGSMFICVIRRRSVLVVCRGLRNISSHYRANDFEELENCGTIAFAGDQNDPGLLDVASDQEVVGRVCRYPLIAINSPVMG